MSWVTSHSTPTLLLHLTNFMLVLLDGALSGWWEHWHIASIDDKYNIGYTPRGGEEGRGQECQGRRGLSYPTRQPPRFWQRNQVSACIGYGSVFLPDLKETRGWDLRLVQRASSWFSHSRGRMESLKHQHLDMELLYLIQSSSSEVCSAKPLSLISGGDNEDGLPKWWLYCVNKKPGMKTERVQRLMNTANHKPASESARLSSEMSKCKAFAGMKSSSASPLTEGLMGPLYL